MHTRSADEVAESQDERVQRRVVAAVVVATALLVWRGAADAHAVVKLTALALGCVGILAIGGWRVLASGFLSIPRSLVGAALVVFLALGGVAVLSSDMRWASLYGPYGRGTGFVAYVLASVVFVGVCTGVRAEVVWRVLRVLVIGAGVMALYALLQRVGGDPIDWNSPYGDRSPISTLGNSNFTSGYLGAVLPLAVWFAITARDWMRWAGAGAAGVLGLAIVATGSAQGVLAAGAGLGLLGVVAIVVHTDGGLRRRLLGGIAAAGVVAGVLVALGLAGSGPASRLHDAGFQYRRYYWSAAAEMLADEPLTGVGFERWGSHYREVRSQEAASFALSDVSDEPHSVPLSMFAGGGYPLGIAYLGLVAAVGFTLVRGLRRADRERRLLLGAVGGAWLAYQVQSAVSIDVPAFPPLHLLLAGLIVVLSGSLRWRTVRIPFLLVERTHRTRSRNVVVDEAARLGSSTAIVIVAVLGVVVSWQLLRPLRADMALAAAQRSGSVVGAAFDDLRSAMRLNPWEPEYRSQSARAIAQQKGTEAIVKQAFEGALELDGRRFADVVNAARAAAVADQLEDAVRLYRRAMELEPHSAELKAQFGEFLTDIGDKRAVELLEDAVREQPDRIAWRISLAEAHGLDDPRERRAEMTTIIDELAAEEPPQYDVLRDITTRMQEIEEWDLALAAMGPELRDFPDSPGTRYVVARIYESAGRVEEALALYDEIAKLPPEEPFADAADRAAALRSGA